MLDISVAVLAVLCSAYATPNGGFFNAFKPFYALSPFRPTWTGFPFQQSNPWYIHHISAPPLRPWYEGDNVCKEVKVFDEPEISEWMSKFDDGGQFNLQSEQCRGRNEENVCIRRISTNEGSKMEMTKYGCCHGFVRVLGGSGCVEIDLRYLVPTLRNMGASELVKVVEKIGMMDDFHNNNYTVFCPPNSVLDALQNEVEEEMDNDIAPKINQQKVKKKTQLYNIITAHLFPGFFKTDDLVDQKVLPTDNPKYKIRMNIYYTPLRVITANCIPVMSGDGYARNGIVHVVEKLLPMPSRTVADIIAGDTQFTILKRMLSLAGLVQTLRNENGSYTMFAPTDSALKSLSYLTGESDNRCTVSLMKYHIINHVICSSAIPYHARSLNMIGELLNLSRDQNNKLYVDDVQIVVRDLMATNGVVHIIDGILSARQTKPISHVLDESGLYEFLYLIEKANLKSEFNSLENITFFIPTNEVIQGIPPRHLDALLKYNNHSLQDVLRFHVVNGQAELKSPDQLLNSKLENSSIRFQVYRKYPQMTLQVLAQCATVLTADIKFCGGTLHVIDKMLLPPKLTIIEFLENIEGFSTLVLLLRATNLDKKLRNEESTFTLFAPTDDAFHQMGEAAIFKILEDVEKATDLVKMHIIPGSVCCSQMNNDLLSGRRQTWTMEGSLLNLDRSIDGILMTGGAHVVDCDIMATNGVIHMVDAVLYHEQTSYLGGGFLDNLFIVI